MVSELNGVGVLQMSVCKWIEVEILWSSGMPTRLSLGSLSLVLDLAIKNGVGLPCTNWSGAGAALLMSPRQGETSQHKYNMRGVAGCVTLRPDEVHSICNCRGAYLHQVTL